MADQIGQPQQGNQGQQGQPGQPQGPGPAAPQRGIPGAQQPPTPSPEQIAKIMAQQAQTIQVQAQESQRRAKLLADTAEPGQPVQVLTLDPRQPPQPQRQPAPAPVQPAPASPIPGMSAAEVIAGPARVQQGGELAQYAQQQQVDKIVVPWYPARSGGSNVELEDSIIQFVPDSGISGEGDAQAKVVLALFSEILSLREKVQQLQLAPVAAPAATADTEGLERRVLMLENFIMRTQPTPQQMAQSARDQATAMTARGAAPEEVLPSLQSAQGETAPVHTPAEGQVAAQDDMADKWQGDGPVASGPPPSGSE